MQIDKPKQSKINNWIIIPITNSAYALRKKSICT